jgi:hypothetical protein
MGRSEEIPCRQVAGPPDRKAVNVREDVVDRVEPCVHHTNPREEGFTPGAEVAEINPMSHSVAPA